MIKESHICPRCGKEFFDYKSNNRKLCSLRCAHAASGDKKVTTEDYRKLRRIWGDMKRNAAKEIAPGVPIAEVDLGWKASFFIFQSWAVASGYVAGQRFARRDKTKGYEPSNCHFIKEAIKC